MASQRSFIFIIVTSVCSLIPVFGLEYFEISKPVIEYKGRKKICTVQLLENHLFSTPAHSIKYVPPTGCGDKWRLAVLTWTANVSAAQPARIGRVTFDGLQVLKTITPIGTADSNWTFDVDVTRFIPFLKSERLLSVVLQDENIYSGELYLNLTLTVYQGSISCRLAQKIVPVYNQSSSDYSPFNFSYLQTSGSAVLSNLPRNIYRAEIEISQIESSIEQAYWALVDPLYWSSISGEINNTTSGPVFRETLVYIDGLLAGVTWQYPVLNPNEINPNRFSPAVSIGSFLIPTYRVDLTPFVGYLTDGYNHTITFNIVNARNFWEISGALHLWLDERSTQTYGTIGLRNIADLVTPSVSYERYSYVTTQVLRISNITARIQTSFGNLTVVSSTTRFLYNHNDQSWNYGVAYYIYKTSGATSLKITKADGSNFLSTFESFHFPLTFQLEAFYDGGSIFQTKFDHAFNFNKTTYYGKSEYSYETLVNQQVGFHQENRSYNYGLKELTISTYSFLHQNLNYSSNFKGCYHRAYSIVNGTETNDNEDFNCV